MQRQVLGVGQCRKLWRFRSCSRCSSWKVVDTLVRVQRQIGSDSACAAGAVHRRRVEPLFLLFFDGIFRTPSIWTLSPSFQRTFWGALDDEEFFVVEGSGVAGTPESNSQVFCHTLHNQCSGCTVDRFSWLILAGGDHSRVTSLGDVESDGSAPCCGMSG